MDSNLLIYSLDPREPAKRAIAYPIAQHLGETGSGCITTQILSELSSVLLTKLNRYYTRPEAVRLIEEASVFWDVLPVSSENVVEAARARERHSISLWDAQILTVATKHEIRVILSEDLHHGATLDGVTYINPLRPDFRLEDWL